MPFVQRDWKGRITGLFGVQQADAAIEELPEDHPEVQAFRARYPIPPEMLKPLTEKDLQRIGQVEAQRKKDIEAIRLATESFNQRFSEFEVALSALFYIALNRPESKIAYAIYYSPTGFETRARIVENAVLQLATENESLVELVDLWEALSKHIRRCREVRNAIAHGSIVTLHIRDSSHVRLAPPAFDVIRINRKIEKGQVPGLDSHELTRAVRKLCWVSERIDDVNRVLHAFYEGDPLLPKRINATREGLACRDNSQ